MVFSRFYLAPAPPSNKFHLAPAESAQATVLESSLNSLLFAMTKERDFQLMVAYFSSSLSIICTVGTAVFGLGLTAVSFTNNPDVIKVLSIISAMLGIILTILKGSGYPGIAFDAVISLNTLLVAAHDLVTSISLNSPYAVPVRISHLPPPIAPSSIDEKQYEMDLPSQIARRIDGIKEQWELERRQIWSTRAKAFSQIMSPPLPVESSSKLAGHAVEKKGEGGVNANVAAVLNKGEAVEKDLEKGQGGVHGGVLEKSG